MYVGEAAVGEPRFGSARVGQPNTGDGVPYAARCEALTLSMMMIVMVIYIYEAPLPPPAVARPSGTVQCRCDLSTVVAVAESLASAMHVLSHACSIA